MPRKRSRIWLPAVLASAGGLPLAADAQVAGPPGACCPVHSPNGCPQGPLSRSVGCVKQYVHTRIIGDPALFAEPPLGFYLAEIDAVNIGKTDVHRFTLYRSDFVGKSATLSPGGAQRLSLLSSRLSCWPGPVIVEWTPDQPGLAEARRAAVEGLLQRSGTLAMNGRVIVGPSPFAGELGTEGANNYDNLIFRNQDAARQFSRSPVPQVTIIGSGGP